ncbi:hypothetical protein [Roseivivax marinus]|uniref:hypothetical protein n=1 Tax=Roseivivax marinus TaxID=1379903 RepID=UPI00273F7308|nr:hypothetical protein [Roseivivax marinus]
MSPISKAGTGPVTRPWPQVETGAIQRHDRNMKASEVAASERRRDTQAIVAAHAGEGAASSAYRMAQILGMPPEHVSMLKPKG